MITRQLPGLLPGVAGQGPDPGTVSGDGCNEEVLSGLGLSKDTTAAGRGGSPGGAAVGGQPQGAMPDVLGSGTGGYVLEIKKVMSLAARTPIQIQEAYAQLTASPYWIIVPEGAHVSPAVIARAEGTGGGVIYRSAGAGRGGSYADPSGNPVQVQPGTMQVTGYQASTPGAAGTLE